MYLPVGDIKEPFVDIEDLADIVFQSLIDEKHKNQIYEVTGPALLSFRDVISDIAVATNRNIEFHQVSMDEYVMYMTEAKVRKLCGTYQVPVY